MKSFTRHYVAVIALCVLIGQVSAGDVVTDFWKCLNGNYSDINEVNDDISSQPTHDLVVANFIPVTTPALPGPGIYAVETLNGQVLRMKLWSLSAGSKNVVNAKVYTIKTTSMYNSGDFNPGDFLAALKPDDLSSDHDCVANFMQLSSGTFTGGGLDCDDNAVGTNSVYAGIIECDRFEINIPNSAPEATASSPYVLVRQGGSYPLPNIPTA